MDGSSGGGVAAAGIVYDGAVAALRGEIVWVGRSAEAPARVRLVLGAERIDATGRVVTPGLVDPHTHLVYAGDRADEFAQRCGGASYLDLARAGGGIQATVRATREASASRLLALSLSRARRLLEQGVTTCEVKSGYGLTVEKELALLRVIRELGQATPLEVIPTLLALHALPPDRDASRQRFVREVTDELVPSAAASGLCTAVDAFLEEGAFDKAEVGHLFEAAQKAGLALRLHADQLSPGGGAEFAAAYGARSADHLEQVSNEGILALARAGTIAVLCPIATFVLKLPGYAPARRLLDAGVSVALCTNVNPGSAPTESVPLTLGHACISYGLQPAEALHAFTRGAAQALGLDGRLGRIAVGREADLALFGCADHRHLASHLGQNHCVGVVKRGLWIAHPGGLDCSG